MPETVRLPVLKLLGFALHDVFGNLGGLVRIAWPYYALAVVGGWARFLLLGGPDLATALRDPGIGSSVIGLAGLACSVKWQRHVVLAEPLRGIAPLNLRVLRYFLWIAFLWLLWTLPFLIGVGLAYAMGLVGPDPTGAALYRIGPAGILLGVAGGLAGAFLVLRLSLVLPAVCADDRSVTLARSWQLTRANATSLLAAFVLLTLGLVLLGAAIGLIQAALETAAESGSLMPALTGLLLEAGVKLIASVSGASLFAYAYVRLTGATGRGSAAPQ